MNDKQIVTPWETKCGKDGFDYDRMIKKFGCQKLGPELLKRFKEVTGHKPHMWMKRGIFFAHRGLDEILDDVEKGKSVFLYTGRGPSSDMHIGHAISFTLTAWLQKVLKAVTVIQIADDEKYHFKDMEFDEIYNLGFKNAKDIISFGFDPKRTFIFSNRDFSINRSYANVFSEISKRVNINTVQSIFGIKKDKCMGQLIWPIYQTTASFSQSFDHIFGDNNYRCLVLYAIDQDPYFRLARDVAPKLNFLKPCSIIGKFLPALEGKMKLSSTGINAKKSTIFLSDSNKVIKKKIMKFALSSGGTTIELHRKNGGNPDKDIPCQWLEFFMDSHTRLKEIKDEFKSGRLLCGEIKKILADKIITFINVIRKAKTTITDNDVKLFYEQKKLKLL